MGEKIQPVLGPDEWALVIREGDPVLTLSMMGDGIAVSGMSDHLVATAQIVAVANHFLPHGHPNKLTLRQVHALGRIVARTKQDLTENDDDREDTLECERLQRQLEALLPPEEHA